MRVLQAVLFIAGSTALGAVSSIVLIYLLMRAVLPAPRGDLNYGGVAVLFGFLVCGGALGAIAGLMTSLAWSSTVSRDPWRPVTWFGVVLGGAAGVALCFAAPDYNELWLIFTHATFMIAACAGGGLFTTAVFPLWTRPAAKPGRRKGHDGA